jgi:hypothetical protein
LGDGAQGIEELIAMVDLGEIYRTKDIEVHALLPDDVEAVEVSLEYGARRTTLSLRAQGEHVRVRWPYDPGPGPNYRYRYEVLFKPDAPAWAGPCPLSSTGTADQRRLVIAPSGRSLLAIQRPGDRPGADRNAGTDPGRGRQNLDFPRQQTGSMRIRIRLQSNVPPTRCRADLLPVADQP